MKKLYSLATIAVAVATVAFAFPAEAKWKWGGSGVNGTQAQLQAQINQGVANGRLTQQEAAQLQSRMNEINQLEAQYRASGGKLSKRERDLLESKLDRLGDSIRRQLNDYDTRWRNKSRKDKKQGRRYW